MTNLEIARKYHADAAEANIRTVQHFDMMPLTLDGSGVGRVRKNKEGFLVGIAPVAKVGVMKYLMADGQVLREFVPPETLFDEASMETLKLRPMTNNHPEERKVTVDNANYRTVGFTGENVAQKDGKLTTSFSIHDKYAIDEIDNQGKQELSPGYECDLSFTPGSYNGEDYDAVQVRRRYNHLAVVSSARGGRDIKMNRMDGAEVGAFVNFNFDEDDLKMVATLDALLDKEVGEDAKLSTEKRKGLKQSSFCGPDRSFPVPDCAHVTAARRLIGRYKGTGDKSKILACVERKAQAMGCKESNTDTNPKQEIRKMVKVNIDGLEYDAAPEVLNLVSKQDARIKALEKGKEEDAKETEKLKGERDAAKAEAESAKAGKDKEINDAVEARLGLERLASVVLDGSFDSKMSSRGLKVAMLAKKLPMIKVDDSTSEIYLDAVLDTVRVQIDGMDSVTRQVREMNRDGGAVSRNANPNNNLDEAEEARKKMIKRAKNKGEDDSVGAPQAERYENGQAGAMPSRSRNYNRI